MEFKPFMLARTPPPCQTADWRRELAEAYTHPEDLLEDLGLPRDSLPGIHEASRNFPFLVTRAYAAGMRRGDGNDPLLRQVLPTPAELVPRAGYSTDPVGDGQALHAPGLLRKYRGRALLLLTGACAVHCRYCFRRHFPYAQDSLLRDRQDEAVRELTSDRGISEVILSGGDPLTYDDGRLAGLISKLSDIGHLRRLRLHTRLPIVLPSRVTPRLCAMLADAPVKTLVVVQANHPRELGEQVRPALAALAEAGLPLLNQSVLLHGVNDATGTLAELSEALFDCGVLPYYLHLLDPVSGAGHFDVPAKTAATLMNGLRARLPGYLVPRLVRETAGAAFKQPVS
jgi:EF-P beta-lysylation protein EpmB